MYCYRKWGLVLARLLSITTLTHSSITLYSSKNLQILFPVTIIWSIHSSDELMLTFIVHRLTHFLSQTDANVCLDDVID